MFKKTLLALAITGFAGAASAATIPQLSDKVSAEGVANETTITASDVVVLAGIANGYGEGDVVTFTFPNDVFDISTDATLVAAQDAGPAGAAPVVVFSSPTYTNANTVSFTIDTVTDPILLADTLTLSGVVFEADNAVAGGDIDVSFAVTSSVNGSDYEAVSATILESMSQFDVEVTAGDEFSGVVDVNQARKLFVNNAPTTTTTDELVVTSSDDSGSVTMDATLGSISYTLNGDFSFMDTDGDGTPDYGVTVSGTSDEAIAADMQSITWTDDTGGAMAHTVVVTASDAGTPTLIPVQEFTVDTVFSYDPNTAGASEVEESHSDAAGEWTLNGSSFTVNYMPFGPNTKPILNIQHTGTLAGELLVNYLVDGDGWKELDLGGLMIEPGLTSLKTDVMDAIAAAVEADTGATSGKVSLQVTVNAPKASISAFAGFKVSNAAGESRVAIGTYGQLGTDKNATF